MKFILTTICLSIFFVSCNNYKTNKIAPSSKDVQVFENQISTFYIFRKAFNDEDIDLLMSNLSDTLKWSPPQYNNNVTLGYEEYKQTILGYFDQFDNITFYESEGSLFNVKTPAFWAGSVFSSVIDSATTSPLNMRVYGTWKAIHTESGAEVGNKWYGLFGFNEDGKIASISDWMDVSGMQNQIENHIMKGQ